MSSHVDGDVRRAGRGRRRRGGARGRPSWSRCSTGAPVGAAGRGRRRRSSTPCRSRCKQLAIDAVRHRTTRSPCRSARSCCWRRSPALIGVLAVAPAGTRPAPASRAFARHRRGRRADPARRRPADALPSLVGAVGAGPAVIAAVELPWPGRRHRRCGASPDRAESAAPAPMPASPARRPATPAGRRRRSPAAAEWPGRRVPHRQRGAARRAAVAGSAGAGWPAGAASPRPATRWRCPPPVGPHRPCRPARTSR